jgi:hypothetical protein
MVNAPYATVYPPGFGAGFMMNKSLRGREAESSDKRGYGFRGSFSGIQPALEQKQQLKYKKEPPEDRRL